jgi:hypothetical protein
LSKLKPWCLCTFWWGTERMLVPSITNWRSKRKKKDWISSPHKQATKPIDSADWSRDFHGYTCNQHLCTSLGWTVEACGSSSCSLHVNPGLAKVVSRIYYTWGTLSEFIPLFWSLKNNIWQELWGVGRWDLYPKKQWIECLRLALAQGYSCYSNSKEKSCQPKWDSYHYFPKLFIITKPPSLQPGKASLACQDPSKEVQ